MTGRAHAAATDEAQDDARGPEVLSQVEVAARLGISDESWRRWRAAGLTPEPVRMPSGRLKWRTVDIDALVGQRPERPGRRHYFGFKAAAHARTVTRAFPAALRNEVERGDR